MIDTKLSPKPATPSEDPTWGGYQAKFKLIPRERYEQLKDQLKDDPTAMSRAALSLNGPTSGSSLSIDISKFEFLKDSETVIMDIDGFKCKVYSLRLVVAEKLRAIVQQMPEAPPEQKRTRRPRDFFDIYILCSGKEEMLGESFGDLLAEVFAAKKTPLHLLGKIVGEQNFHEIDWPSVRDTAPAAGPDFEPYFKYVVALANRYISVGT